MLRRSPIERRTPLKRSGWLKRTAAKVQRRRYTGPTLETKLLLWDRSDGYCEWPGCLSMATEPHHRLNRKMGGRHGPTADLLNSVAWLMASCRFHNEYCANAKGLERVHVRDWGWVLVEGESAPDKPVRTQRGWVRLLDNGGWEMA